MQKGGSTLFYTMVFCIVASVPKVQELEMELEDVEDAEEDKGEVSDHVFLWPICMPVALKYAIL